MPRGLRFWTGCPAKRRAAPLTVQAYAADLRFFLEFLRDHLGREASTDDLAALSQADLRAWLAHGAARGRGNATRARHVAALTRFFPVPGKAARYRGMPLHHCWARPAPRNLRRAR